MHIAKSPMVREEQTLSVFHEVSTDAQEFKNKIYQDIIQNGLPIYQFSDMITIRFQQKNWTFSLGNLKLLDLGRFVLDDGDALMHPGNVHALNFARYPILIPDIHGKLFSASHAAASMLLKEFFDAHRRYIEAQNLLFKTIDDAVLENFEDRVRLWKTIYGTEDLYEDIMHMKL